MDFNENDLGGITHDEIREVLESIYHKYGYDFLNYSQAHLMRRIKYRMALSKINSIEVFKKIILNDHFFAHSCFNDFSIPVTEMYRDPGFFLSFRTNVIPFLKTFPYIRIWAAGCATGEEVYSIAIALLEEGLIDKCMIYGTDFNESALNQARAGEYPVGKINKSSQNYSLSGGLASFFKYFTREGDTFQVLPFFKDHIVWSNHNLVTDSVFAEVQLILCRNVLIYFNNHLQLRVHDVFMNSLVNGGFLCLGIKETILDPSIKRYYRDFDKKNRIFQKKYLPNQNE